MYEPRNPAQIERDLETLRAANQQATRVLMDLEEEHETAQAAYAVALEKARLSTWSEAAGGDSWTESHRNAYAVAQTEQQRIALAAAAGKVRAARARAAGIRTEVDIIRSQSALLRSALEVA